MKRILLLLLIAVFLLQAGCLESQTLDESGYVLAIGFDPGDTFAYRVSFAVQKIGTESNEPKTEGFSLHTAEAETLFEAIETVASSLPHQLSFTRTTMILFDLELVQEPGRLEDLLNTEMERLQIRYNVNVFVAIDGAKAVLEGLAAGELKLSLDKLQSHFLDYAQETSFLPLMSLMQLYEATITRHTDAVLPLIGTTEGLRRLGVADSVGTSDYALLGGRMAIETELQAGVGGAALFHNGQMVGVLDAQNVQLLLLATGKFHNGGVRFTPPAGGNGEVYLNVSPSGSPEIELTLGERPCAQVRLRLKMDLMHPARLESGTAQELERQLEEWLCASLQRLFDTCQKLGADSFGFGKLAVQKFTSVSAWEAYDWSADYRRLEVAFKVDVTLDTHEKNAFLK